MDKQETQDDPQPLYLTVVGHLCGSSIRLLDNPDCYIQLSGIFAGKNTQPLVSLIVTNSPTPKVVRVAILSDEEMVK